VLPPVTGETPTEIRGEPETAPFDLFVRGGTLVRPREGTFKAELAIKGGRIAAIVAHGERLPAKAELSVEGLHIFPGGVDPHAHIGLGGGTDEYGPDTGAAALGGITTVFYILIDGGSYRQVIESHRTVADASVYVDYAFHVTLMTDEHIAELPYLRDRWAVDSYKYYMSFRGEEGAYLGVAGTDDGAFLDILEGVARIRSVLMVHPENIEVVWRLRDRLKAAGRDDLRAWNESRPPFTEAESIGRAAYLSAQTGCALYLVHVSCEAALDEVRGARRRFPQTQIFSETCPHFLTHSADSSVGVLGKVNPPLRSAEDREALWTGIFDGTIDTVGSDHVGRRREKKQGSIWSASAGFPGLPTLLPVLISEGYHKRGLPLERIADLASRRPAEIFGRGDRKGDIQIGFDADLAIVDLQWERIPDAAWLGTWSDYSLYESWPLKGWPRYTLVRGQLVQQDGELIGAPGFGSYVASSLRAEIAQPSGSSLSSD
jgi:dihydropyrimidinase